MPRNNKSNIKKLSSPIRAYVFRKATRVCPFCNVLVKGEIYVAKRNRLTKTELTICPKCEKQFIPYSLYCGEKNHFICLNPEELQKYDNEEEQKRAESRVRQKEIEKNFQITKQKIAGMIYPVLSELNPFTAAWFDKEWPKTKISPYDLEALIAAYVVRKDGGQISIIFVTSKKKKSLPAFYIIGANDWLGKKLLVSKAAGYDSFYIADKLHEILETVIIDNASYNRHVKALGYLLTDHSKPKIEQPRTVETTQSSNSISTDDTEGELERISVYVHARTLRVCPPCNCHLQSPLFETGSGTYLSNAVFICPKCKRAYTSSWVYSNFKSRFISLNPEETEQLLNSPKIVKDYGIQEHSYEKAHILNLILKNHSFYTQFKSQEFIDAWLKAKLSKAELDSLSSAYFIIANGNDYCYFISSLEKYNNTAIGKSLYATNPQSKMGKKLLEIRQGTYVIPRGQIKPFDITDYIYFNGTEQNSQQKDVNNGSFISVTNATVYVYFRLTNSCMRKNHTIEAVTAKTANAKDGMPINVNVFHCRNCDKYFINYEALQKYISKGIYPALQYSLINDISGSLNDASKLMLYGYNVAEGNLTQLERRSILSWIIDSNLLSKSEIISDLQFKVRYNGSKAGNERARQKWLDDIQFVSRYVQGNSKTINATFVTRPR